MRPIIKRKSWMIGLFLFLFSFPGFSQEEPSLEKFYGNKDLKGGNLGYDFLLNNKGGVSSLELFYLTQAKKSAYAQRWLYYYGVSVEGANGEGEDYQFSGRGEGDFSAWWIGIWINGRIFYQDTSKLRPYFDFGGGLGIGEIKAEGEDFEIGWTRLNLLLLRAGLGAELMLNQNWSLDLGIGAKALAGMMGGILESADLVFSGVEFKIGISQWSENKRR